MACSRSSAARSRSTWKTGWKRKSAAASRPWSSCSAIVLLAATDAGYERLVDLVSRAYLGGESNQAVHISASWLEEAGTEGLIALTGALTGPVDVAIKEGHPAQAEARLLTLKRLFGDRLYVELQRHGTYDKRHEQKIVGLAYAHDLPLVATNEAFFPTRDDYDAHDALMAVAHNAIVSDDSRFRLTPDHYLKSRAEMAKLFADLPEALENTIEIARRCSFVLKTRKPILPRFTGATDDAEEAERAEASELRRQAVEGLDMRLSTLGMSPGYEEKDYRERLEFELSVIERMRFPGYFLIVADFIKWAKQHDIPVGPGRGSGAGSLVAYALTITDVDPLRFSLLFERFLNPERVSMPDFDIDFCQDRREEVIRYVQAKYGREQVAQIITFGSLQARAALRDVGRVLEMPYGQVDKICKLVPNNPANPTPLSKAIEEEPKLQEEAAKEPVVARLLDIAQKIEGLYRHASTHAVKHRHRRPAAFQAGADVSRSALGHAGHPVQHEMGGAGRPRQVRLPRPEDADRAEGRGRFRRQARRQGRSRGHSSRRQEDLRDAVARRDGRRVPGGKS